MHWNSSFSELQTRLHTTDSGDPFSARICKMTKGKREDQLMVNQPGLNGCTSASYLRLKHKQVWDCRHLSATNRTSTEHDAATHDHTLWLQLEQRYLGTFVCEKTWEGTASSHNSLVTIFTSVEANPVTYMAQTEQWWQRSGFISWHLSQNRIPEIKSILVPNNRKVLILFTC